MIQNYWKSFLENMNRDANEKCAAVLCFGMDARGCEIAVEKILSGEKRCSIYPADGYRKAMSGAAKMGELSIITDWKGIPCAVIETTGVHQMAISELTDEICAKEGVEVNLAAWREKQMPFLKTEVEELGGAFSDSILVTVEEFKLVYPNA